ncbi:MAG: hypothetical protein FJY97_02945 [candidate division Zixibacteria bacterium]|nr:hypothetical protein [candidate division Zixibacteria bacterium]
MNAPTVLIDGSLTRERLACALRAAAGERWCGETVQIKGPTRSRDMALYTTEGIVFIEYDDAIHYTDPFRIRIDREQDRIAEKHGHRIIRFPYWLQLDTQTFRRFFELTATVTQEIPHGFSPNAVFPAAFCEAGLKRFIRELQGLPRPTGDAVARSLRMRVAEYGLARVLPESLWHVAETTSPRSFQCF